MLNRKIKVEFSGFNDTIITEQLGWDVNNDDTLTITSSDRIILTDIIFLKKIIAGF